MLSGPCCTGLSFDIRGFEGLDGVGHTSSREEAHGRCGAAGGEALRIRLGPGVARYLVASKGAGRHPGECRRLTFLKAGPTSRCKRYAASTAGRARFYCREALGTEVLDRKARAFPGRLRRTRGERGHSRFAGRVGPY